MIDTTPPRRRLPPHTRQILAAIADGARMDDLLDERHPWVLNDIAAVLRAHNLVADHAGRITRGDAHAEPLLRLAEQSSSPLVRRQAARAQAALAELAKLLAHEQDARADEADRARQRKALREWLAELAELRTDAERELRRVNSRNSAKGA